MYKRNEGVKEGWLPRVSGTHAIMFMLGSLTRDHSTPILQADSRPTERTQVLVRLILKQIKQTEPKQSGGWWRLLLAPLEFE